MSADRRIGLPEGPPGPFACAMLALAGGLAGSALRGGCEWLAVALDLAPWVARAAVNVTGAFAIGVLVARIALLDDRGAPAGVPSRRRGVEHLLGAGLLGGYTTVSGFALDAAAAVAASNLARAATLMLVDGGVGIAAVGLGFAVGMAWRRRLDRAAHLRRPA